MEDYDLIPIDATKLKKFVKPVLRIMSFSNGEYQPVQVIPFKNCEPQDLFYENIYVAPFIVNKT